MAIKSWRGLIPDAFYNNKMERYIFFSSLFYKNPEGDGPIIAKQANDYLYKNSILSPTQYTTSNIQTEIKVEAVFNFLDQIIQNEKNKELRFLQYMANKKNKGLNIYDLPDLQSNWKNFVLEFNKNMRLGQDAIQRLLVEKKRLEYNINTMEQQNREKVQSGKYSPTDFEQAQKGYIRSANLITSTQLSKVVDFLGGNHRAKTGQKVVEYILKRIGPQLIEFEKTTIALNKKQIIALIVGISHIILDEYNTLVNEAKLDDIAAGKKKNYAVTRDLEAMLKKSTKINELFQDLITPKNFPMLADKFIQEYAIDLTTASQGANIAVIIKNYDANLQKQLSEQTRAQQLARDITKLCKPSSSTQRTFQNAFQLTSNKNALSEIKDATVGLIGEAIHSHRVGHKQGKTDVILGFLNIDTSTFTSDNEFNTYYKVAKEISETLYKLEESFSGVNTKKYYLEQQKNWQQALDKINKFIIKLQQIFNDKLINCFIIEDSTKFYDSFQVTKNINGDVTWSTFQGGSAGANIEDQINKIFSLYDIGGITPSDVTWLLDACLNTGPDMIGSANKQNLENYFSAIAAILLFDNQFGLVKEAIYNVKNENINYNVNQLHLFSLNDGYYPISFLLQNTKDYLKKIYTQIESELSDSTYGVQVSLTNFVKHPQPFHPVYNPMTPQAWEEIEEQGKKNTQLEITFLAGFLDLLNALFNPPQ